MNTHGVYVICFDVQFKYARHYVGWASNIAERIEDHKTTGGRCARLMRAVNLAGITWTVTRIFPGREKEFERQLKKRGGAARICPRCCGVRGADVVALVSQPGDKIALGR